MPLSPPSTTVATSIAPTIGEQSSRSQPSVSRLEVPVQGKYTSGKKAWWCYEERAKESGTIPSLSEWIDEPGDPSVMAGTAVFEGSVSEGYKLHPDTCFTFNTGGGGESINLKPADRCFPFTAFTAARNEFGIGGEVSFTPEADEGTYAQLPTFEFALAPSATPQHRMLFIDLFGGKMKQVKGRDENGHLVDDSVIGDEGSKA